MSLLKIFKRSAIRRTVLFAGHVVPDPSRCVQCGICSDNCPIEIDVRAYAWRGESINKSECLTCGECVARCPRGVLRFEKTDLFTTGEK
ncbi:MAG: 4Fe-4S binding protein [Anaerolineales bacterium]|nr:4Fe-4S binding protein [Anaerolineales bacterium]